MVLLPKTLSKSQKQEITAAIKQERQRRKTLDRVRREHILTRKRPIDYQLSYDISKLGTDGADAMGRLEEAQKELSKGRLENLTHLLPLLFNLDNEPYHLRRHFPFEPFYNTRLPLNTVWKTGRQVSKSTNQAVQGVLLCNLISHFHTLFITPLYELTRRFSSNYVYPRIQESPVRELWSDTTCTNSVLQRSFLNGSLMHFSFASTDCDRTRGISAAKLVIDECQDLDPAFLPILKEVMSASPWKITQLTGTPKTLENLIQYQWENSSMAEWAVRCTACNKVNIPSLEEDLDGMLGPHIVTREISARHPAIVCANCGKPINPADPKNAGWLHKRPERRFDAAGYHVPQCIMPMHYEDPKAWMVLQGKRQGFGRTPLNVFFNEVCGESYDYGTKLLTLTDLQAAATLHENELDIAVKTLGNYTQRILSVDWGGGGEKEVSFTTAAVLGMRPDGKIDVIYGWRSLTPNAPVHEAIEVLKLMQVFRCSHLVHDFGGAGSLREVIIEQSGLPAHRIIPISYLRVNVGPMMSWKPFNENTGKRAHHQLDKSRSLQYVCELIKCKYIRFFRYDHHGPDNPGLLHDFLALVEDKVGSRFGSDIFTIIRNEKAGPDDFAQAVNMGCCALFHARESWPDVALENRINIDPAVWRLMTPISEQFWEDLDL